MSTQLGSQGPPSSSQPSTSTGAPENLWKKFHNYCRAQKIPMQKVEVNTGDDTNPEWLVTIRILDRSWTNSRPERAKMLAKEDVTRLVLNDWATQPQLFNAPFPPFGGSIVGTHTGSSPT
ncbi:hypothetical protein M407DRAFT_22033 [Tulasnella calospora MUT 4182]|uniref:DRBM domain-containing protein n=1 Tax=Tulasnella calospora MUT 4182 TaxID=1051891 RepID=A0A0C3QD30_9AGAM|nr:hypothetical protein M407DRAFT_22033 [Tulasnella calospora MUT 4182]